MKHEYHLESFAIGKWLKILEGSLQYCQGFLDARKDYAPRNAYRLMRSDGRVMEEVPAREDVNIGQIAGWPSAEQYEAAANKALERAKAIRERANDRTERPAHSGAQQHETVMKQPKTPKPVRSSAWFCAGNALTLRDAARNRTL